MLNNSLIVDEVNSNMPRNVSVTEESYPTQESDVPLVRDAEQK